MNLAETPNPGKTNQTQNHMNPSIRNLAIAILLTLALSRPMFSAASDTNRATTVISVTLKSYDNAQQKDCTVEYQNKSGKEITHHQGTLTFTDTAGKVLFTTGVTQDHRKAWANDATSEDKPFRFLNMPADLAATLDKNKQSVILKFTASDLKYSDGTEEKF
jgi:hypothetical protein